jgi:hypothetical protein
MRLSTAAKWLIRALAAYCEMIDNNSGNHSTWFNWVVKKNIRLGHINDYRLA